MKSLSRWLLRSLMIGVLVSCSGCVWMALGAGASAIAWKSGELKSQERASLAETLEATKASLGEIEYRIRNVERTEVSATVEAVGADDNEVRVRLRRIDARDTEVKIRFGVMGNEAYSRLLLEKIQRRLK